FPRTAIGLKIGWTLIKGNTPTIVPVWDGQPTRPLTDANPPGTWPRAVVVDPTVENIPPDAKMTINWRGNPLEAHVVTLSRFYNFQITSAELGAVRAVMGSSAEIGDYAA